MFLRFENEKYSYFYNTIVLDKKRVKVRSCEVIVNDHLLGVTNYPLRIMMMGSLSK